MSLISSVCSLAKMVVVLTLNNAMAVRPDVRQTKLLRGSDPGFPPCLGSVCQPFCTQGALDLKQLHFASPQ